jgi:hypothetical protein
MDTLFWIVVGAMIGWNFPQPWWAKTIQSKIIDFFSRKS